MNYCQNCGSKLEPEMKFCGNCGSSIRASEDRQSVVTSIAIESAKKNVNSSIRKSKKEKIWRIIIGALLICFILAMAIFVRKTERSKPEQRLDLSANSAPSITVDMLMRTFHEKMGWTEERIREEYGAPDKMEQAEDLTVLTYEGDTRLVFGIKRGKVMNCMMIIFWLDDNTVWRTRDGAVLNLTSQGFTRLSDFQNIVRYGKHGIEISLLPVQTGLRQWSFTLMAMKQLHK